MTTLSCAAPSSSNVCAPVVKEELRESSTHTAVPLTPAKSILRSDHQQSLPSAKKSVTFAEQLTCSRLVGSKTPIQTLSRLSSTKSPRIKSATKAGNKILTAYEEIVQKIVSERKRKQRDENTDLSEALLNESISTDKRLDYNNVDDDPFDFSFFDRCALFEPPPPKYASAKKARLEESCKKTDTTACEEKTRIRVRDIARTFETTAHKPMLEQPKPVPEARTIVSQLVKYFEPPTTESTQQARQITHYPSTSSPLKASEQPSSFSDAISQAMRTLNPLINTSNDFATLNNVPTTADGVQAASACHEPSNRTEFCFNPATPLPQTSSQSVAEPSYETLAFHPEPSANRLVSTLQQRPDLSQPLSVMVPAMLTPASEKENVPAQTFVSTRSFLLMPYVQPTVVPQPVNHISSVSHPVANQPVHHISSVTHPVAIPLPVGTVTDKAIVGCRIITNGALMLAAKARPVINSTKRTQDTAISSSIAPDSSLKERDPASVNIVDNLPAHPVLPANARSTDEATTLLCNSSFTDVCPDSGTSTATSAITAASSILSDTNQQARHVSSLDVFADASIGSLDTAMIQPPDWQPDPLIGSVTKREQEEISRLEAVLRCNEEADDVLAVQPHTSCGSDQTQNDQRTQADHNYADKVHDTYPDFKHDFRPLTIDLGPEALDYVPSAHRQKKGRRSLFSSTPKVFEGDSYLDTTMTQPSKSQPDLQDPDFQHDFRPQTIDLRPEALDYVPSAHKGRNARRSLFTSTPNVFKGDRDRHLASCQTTSTPKQPSLCTRPPLPPDVLSNLLPFLQSPPSSPSRHLPPEPYQLLVRCTPPRESRERNLPPPSFCVPLTPPRQTRDEFELNSRLWHVKPYQICDQLSRETLTNIIRRSSAIHPSMTDLNMISGEVSSHVVREVRKTTPEIMSRDLAFRIFTLWELRRLSLRCVSRNKLQAIKKTVFKHFPDCDQKRVWRNKCVPSMRKALRTFFKIRVKYIQDRWLQ